jgi:hypothetical protein
MKLIIEIPDQALRAAVEAEVGHAIAEMAEEIINKKLEEVMDIKIERVTKNLPTKINQMLALEISPRIDEALGDSRFNRTAYIKRLVADIVISRVKQAGI